jgi:hypothetical protein
MRSYQAYQIITNHNTVVTLHPASVEELDAWDEDTDTDFVALEVAEDTDGGRGQLVAHLDPTDVEELITALCELRHKMQPQAAKAIHYLNRISEEELTRRNAQEALRFNYDERLPRSVE